MQEATIGCGTKANLSPPTIDGGMSTSAPLDGTDFNVPKTDEAGLAWRIEKKALIYQVGGLQLGIRELDCYTAVTSFLKLDENVSPPDWSHVPARCEGIVFPAVPVRKDLPRLSLVRGYIRYAPRHEDRYYITIAGSYEDYLKGFSGKTRNTLKRHARRFAEAAGGNLVWRVFSTPDEMRRFRELAIEVSKRSYQHASGHGLPESTDFQREMLSEAARGRTRGFILFFQDRPAAYAYCTLDSGVLLYSMVGFDAELSDRSPGRVLLVLILQHLFEQDEIEFFDFGGQEYGYKSFFGTDHLRCARVFFFPPSFRNSVRVLSHIATEGLWQMMSYLKNSFKGFAGKGTD